VGGVVEVQQQALPAIEKSEAEKIVINEGCERAQGDIEQAESAAALGHCHLRAERRVAVHVVDIIGERGVGVVQDGASQAAGWAAEFNVLMNRPVFEGASAATEETQLLI